MNNCNICNKKLSKFSKLNYLTKNSNHSWESDSTFEILNLNSCKVYLGFCKNCYQATILPKFNTNLLYNNDSANIRKKHYEKYFPKFLDRLCLKCPGEGAYHSMPSHLRLSDFQPPSYS